MLSRRDCSSALAAWRRVLGDEGVDTGSTSLDEVGRATFVTTAVPLAILRPTRADQVGPCLEVASKAGIPVHPVSRGCNWGLGSRVPPVDGAAIISLRGLDAIAEFDDELGTVHIEPGVSFGQLAAFLRECGGRWFASVTGAGPGASVLANALDRGHGYGPAGDRASSVVGLDVVLSDGRRFSTGHARFANAQVGSTSRWGVGPWIDGLFFQSNMAVVLGATLHLSRTPTAFAAVALAIQRNPPLEGLVNGLRELRISGVLRGNVALWNTDKLLTTMSRFPRHLAEPPLSEALREAARDRRGAWVGWTGLYCYSEAELREATTVVVEHLTPLVDRMAVVGFGGVLHGREYPDEVAAASALSTPTASPFLGTPSSAGISSVYWRKGEDVRAGDPDRDRCGLRWCAAALPFVGRHAVAASSAAAEAALAQGLEAPLSLVATGDRQIDLLLALTYDRDAPGEETRAGRAQDAFFERMMELGYPPPRVGLHSMAAIDAWSEGGAYDDVIRGLKTFFDPTNVLSPGRYDLWSGPE